MKSSVVYECSYSDSEGDRISQGWMTTSSNKVKVSKGDSGQGVAERSRDIFQTQDCRHKSCGWKTAERKEEVGNEYECQHSFEGMSWLKYLNVG